MDIASMLNLYDGYCSTANAEVTPTTEHKSITSTDELTGETPTTTPAITVGQPIASTASETGVTSDTAATTTPAVSGDDKGLEQSDIIALAASLGVGVPSLLITAFALCVQLRKRRAREDGSNQVLGATVR
ncbi:hypothetical protein LTR56_026461 [Elasticomyces elasticus]|nr:hypothetical protein LTR22_027718 [Elasticomyces elasticus]KAK3615655.1 hypothetical protein LTR56_026461 [Elasticomyces elasticus]KAK5734108.1 hypothetical protein LTS12_026795 [Elasticomyces elasticus]